MPKVISDNKTLSVRGRPKGSKDIKPRKKRQDSNQLAVIAEDDRIKILSHDLEVMKLGRIKNRNDADEIYNRIMDYYSICSKNTIMPTVSGLALALGIDRVTLWDWINNRQGSIKNEDVINVLKNAYSQINTQYEELLTQGKMIPVSAFFLMQNNHGYKQQTDHVITAKQEETESVDDIANRANLLQD